MCNVCLCVCVQRATVHAVCALLSGFTKETCRIMIAMLDVSLFLHTWGAGRGDVVVDGEVWFMRGGRDP